MTSRGAYGLRPRKELDFQRAWTNEKAIAFSFALHSFAPLSARDLRRRSCRPASSFTVVLVGSKGGGGGGGGEEEEEEEEACGPAAAANCWCCLTKLTAFPSLPPPPSLCRRWRMPSGPRVPPTTAVFVLRRFDVFGSSHHFALFTPKPSGEQPYGAAQCELVRPRLAGACAGDGG